MITTLAGAPASPLGLAAIPDQQRACVARGFEAWINYFFFYSVGYRPMLGGLAPLLRRRREALIVSTGSGSRQAAGLERARRQTTRRLGVEQNELFFAEYVNGSDPPGAVFGPDGVLATLTRWREEGQIRYVGATTHDRSLAVRLLRDDRVDVLM